MSRGCPLPEYSSVIRWTVQDVANWLTQNKLKESVSNCRLAGVDGNKLLGVTESDLAGISCPEREIKIIMGYLKQMNMPKLWDRKPRENYPAGQKKKEWYTQSAGYKKPQAPPVDDNSDSDGDNPGWDSDEFSEEDVDYMEPDAGPPPKGRVPPIPNHNQPTVPGRRRTPPRPPSSEEDDDQGDYLDPEISQPSPVHRRQPPPILQHAQSEELYEDPDKQVKVQHIHPGPLPPLPGNKSIIPTRSPSNFRKTIQPPPNRNHIQDSSDSEDTEFYDDPDEKKQQFTAPPPIPSSVPKRPVKKAPAPPPDEVYEDPDVPASPASTTNKGPNLKKPPPPPINKDEEVYEEPDQEPPPLPPPVPNIIPKRPTAKLPPIPQDQVDYEEPSEPQVTPSRPVPPRNPPRPIPQAPHQEEEYEEPDVRSVRGPPRNIPKHPGASKPQPAVFEQDVYEVPDVEPVPQPPQPKKADKSIKQTPKKKSPVTLVEEEAYEEPDRPSPKLALPPPGKRENETETERPASQSSDTTLLPTEDTPTEGTTLLPTEDTPIEDTTLLPTEDTPTEDTTLLPIEDMPIEDTTLLPTEDTPTEDTTLLPTEDMPIEDTTLLPTEDTPTEDPTLLPMEDMPIEDTTLLSTEDTPTEDKTLLPTEDTAMEDTNLLPTEGTPTEDTPTEDKTLLPTGDASMEDTTLLPTEDTPTEEKNLLPMEGTSPLPTFEPCENFVPDSCSEDDCTSSIFDFAGSSFVATKLQDPPPQRSLPPTPKVNYTPVTIREDKGPCPVPPSASASSQGNINLETQKWFYGKTNRNIISQRLEQHRVNGMYVIRDSSKSVHEPYTLQIFYEAKVYNLSIRKRPDNKFAIGLEKPDETAFTTLLELINFFKQNFLVLHGGSQTKLLRSLPKE